MTVNYITIRYNVTGAERKRLADYIAGFLGCEKKYLGMPSAAYQVGYIEVSKDGAITFDDRADSEEIETLLEELEQEGFHAEPAVTTAAEEDAEEVPSPTESVGQDETVGLTVKLPLSNVNAGNLTNLLDAKGKLIQKALGIEATPIEIIEDKVFFPWFDEMPDADTVQAVTHFISALCKMSVEQSHISPVEKPADNEKYAFRCFLLRLGFIGAEYKTERKILLKNLTGSSAFKSGAKKTTEVADDEISE